MELKLEVIDDPHQIDNFKRPRKESGGVVCSNINKEVIRHLGNCTSNMDRNSDEVGLDTNTPCDKSIIRRGLFFQATLIAVRIFLSIHEDDVLK